MAIGAHLE
jgi:hypothetical protein